MNVFANTPAVIDGIGNLQERLIIEAEASSYLDRYSTSYLMHAL